jgi:hypothetical protein
VQELLAGGNDLFPGFININLFALDKNLGQALAEWKCQIEFE